MRPGPRLTPFGAALAAALALATRAAADTTLVAAGSDLRYLANAADPGIGAAWTGETFDDSAWSTGLYGIGYEAATGAENLLRATVPATTFSLYTRAAFTVADITTVRNLFLGCDYDDGFAAWLNGVEIARVNLPAGALAWDSPASAAHESSNGTTPSYTPWQDVSTAALPALRNGRNVLAVGVWNNQAGSSDLVLVPSLIANRVPPELTRGPYLQKATPSGIVIRWRSAAAEDSLVRYGDRPGALAATAASAGATTEHEVELTGLAPATRYFYSVGSSSRLLAGDDADHHFVTPPIAGTGAAWRAWLLGDSGTGDGNAAAVRDAYAARFAGRDTDLWLMLGDNAYDNGSDTEYQAAVFDMYPGWLRAAPLWPTLGNHDARSAASSTQSGVYYDSFTLPRAAEAGGLPSGTEAWYSFDWANVHFICLDSTDSDRTPGGAMLSWLAADLASTLQDWVVAFWHHPPYSKGSHDSDSDPILTDMRQNALPILEAGGVDLVVNGHSHSYERSWLLDGHYGDSTTFNPASMRVDPGDGRPAGDGAYRKPPGGPASHQGAVYTVAGSSGKLGGGTLDHPAMLVSLNVLGSFVLEGNRNRLDATFLDSTGAVRDSFRIVKGTPAPPDAPLPLAATPVSPLAIDLAWVDTAGDEDGFQIERSPDGFDFAPVGGAVANAVAHADTGLLPSTTYWYRVRAFNAAGESAWSNVAWATTLACTGTLGAVGNTLKLARGAAAVQATWTDLADATGYTLYQDAARDGAFPTAAGTSASGAPPGLAVPWPAEPLLYYRVAAANPCGEGPK